MVTRSPYIEKIEDSNMFDLHWRQYISRMCIIVYRFKFVVDDYLIFRIMNIHVARKQTIQKQSLHYIWCQESGRIVQAETNPKMSLEHW
jgi:hypothetical protein